MILKTDRLKLRPMALSDAPVVSVLVGDWDVACQTGRIPHPYSIVAADQWISSLEPDEFVRAIELDDTLIGAVGYVEQGDGTAEIGYWIGKPYWGRGYATEAARRLVDHCFDTEKRRKLTCCHFVDNLASKNVIRKLGFKLVGPTTNWCEARKIEMPALNYERRRPVLPRIGKRIT